MVLGDATYGACCIDDLACQAIEVRDTWYLLEAVVACLGEIVDGTQ